VTGLAEPQIEVEEDSDSKDDSGQHEAATESIEQEQDQEGSPVVSQEHEQSGVDEGILSIPHCLSISNFGFAKRL
jgi:hypothetical protein